MLSGILDSDSKNSRSLDFDVLKKEKRVFEAAFASLHTKLSTGFAWQPNGNARTAICPFCEILFIVLLFLSNITDWIDGLNKERSESY